MAKYVNKAVRVIIVNGKALVPGAEAVELTADEANLLAKEIAKGEIVEFDGVEDETIYEAAKEPPAEAKSGRKSNK